MDTWKSHFGGLCRAALLAIACSALHIVPSAGCDITAVEHELKAAKTLMFYAMTAANSRNELDQVKQHLDRAEAGLQGCTGVNDATWDRCSEALKLLQSDLASREAIARDNLNYQLPLYDVMFGHREDFNTVDEHDEVLIEDLCARILEQPSDQRSLWSVPSVHSWVVFKQPTAPEIHNVAIEYLSAHSNQYVLQVMEYPAAYFDAFPQGDSAELVNEWHGQLAAELARKYGLNHLYLFAFDNKGELEDLSLQYTGVSVLKFDAKAQELIPLQYLEGFKVDKQPAFRNALAAVVLYLLVVLLIGTALSKVKGRPFRRSLGRLAGTAAVFALVLAVALTVGRMYGATPTEFARSVHARASIGLYAVLLPLLLLACLHVYRVIVYKGAELEADLRSVYWVGLSLIPAPLMGFACFKAPASDWWLPALGVPVYLVSVFALSKAFRQAKSHNATATQTWITLGLSAASIIATTFVLQAFPATLAGFTPLVFAAIAPAVAYRFVLPHRKALQSTTPDSSAAKNDRPLRHYKGLNDAFSNFLNDRALAIAELRMEAGWGRTTALQRHVNNLKADGDHAILHSDLKSCLESGNGHVLLAESLRKSDDTDIANIIHDATANQSLNFTQKVVKVVLSIFTDTDPTPAFERLRKFDPDQTAFELLDHLANQYDRTVIWWVDDAELLDEAAVAFLVACLAQNQQRKRPDGTLLLKIILSPAANLSTLQQHLEAAKIPLTLLEATTIEKRVLAHELLQKQHQGYPLADRLIEELKVLIRPELEAGHFNLNAVNALIEYLIDGNQLKLEEHATAAYRDDPASTRKEWVAEGALHALPLEVLAPALNRQVDTSVQYSQESQQLLQIAAAVGVRFDIRVIARAANLPTHEALMLLDPAERAGLIWDDPGEDYVYHFRSRHLKDMHFKEPEAGERQMRQLDRELLRTTGKAAESLFRELPDAWSLLQMAAHQFWLLYASPQHRDHAIDLYEELAEHCEGIGLAQVYGLCIKRLLVLTAYDLHVDVKHLEFALNTHHILPEALLNEAAGRVLALREETSTGAELCLLLLTSLHRARRQSDPLFDQLSQHFEKLCPAEATELHYRAAFNAVYFLADLREPRVREETVAQLLELALEIPAHNSKEMRSLRGEILNSAAGILVDRHGEAARGLEVLTQRFQLLTGHETDSLEQALDHFVSDEGVVQPEAMKGLTWSESKGLALGANVAVRAWFKSGSLDSLTAKKAWKINAYLQEYRGQVNALSYGAWLQVQRGRFDADLVENIEAQLLLVQTTALQATSFDCLSMLAVAMMHRVHRDGVEQVRTDTLSSCLTLFAERLKKSTLPAQFVFVTPPGQSQDVVELICDCRKALLGGANAQDEWLYHKAFTALEALNMSDAAVEVPVDRSLHLLRHFTHISEEEAQALMSENPGLTQAELQSKLNLAGSHFFPDGPVGSLATLEAEVTRLVRSQAASVDFFRPSDRGGCTIGLAFCFDEAVGEEGIARVNSSNKDLVRHECRGNHDRVPVLHMPAPASRWLRFVLHCDTDRHVLTLITAYAGSFAPPFEEKDFWSNWALIAGT